MTPAMASPALQAFWLSGPVVATGVLHMLVVKRDLWPRLRRPLDGGHTFRGKPLFGPNKTWRGLLFMTTGAALLGLLQGLLGGEMARRRGLACIDVAALAGGGEGPLPLAAGYAAVNAVLGLGYALGELPNSFLKRRQDVAPGKTSSGARGAFFFVLDQADSVVAPLVLGAPLLGFPWAVVAHGCLWLTLLHLALNALLHRLKVRKDL